MRDWGQARVLIGRRLVADQSGWAESKTKGRLLTWRRGHQVAVQQVHVLLGAVQVGVDAFQSGRARRQHLHQTIYR